MTTHPQGNRLLVGGLLIAASLGIGAASARWTPRAAGDAPVSDAPLLDGFDAAPPAARRSGDARAAAPVVEKAAAAPTPVAPLLVLEGSASWYADALAGRRTASGEPYDPTELIAAHRALPFGTRLRVTNLGNERSVEVRVIDRGPFVANRILDLSRSAAEQIGIIRAGHGRVRIEVLEYGG